MTPARAAGALGISAMLLASAGSAATAAECLEAIDETRAQTQSAAASAGGSSGQSEERQPGEQQQSGAASDASSEGAPPVESWQGGNQTQSVGTGGKPAIDPAAARWFEIATKLAKNGETGGCWQVLVQAQRILGVIPADTPLPNVD